MRCKTSLPYFHLPSILKFVSKGRILIVAYTFPPGEGGVGMAAFEMAKGLGTLDWDIHVLTREQNPLADPSRPVCCSVASIPDSLTEDRPRLKEYLNTHLGDIQPDFIIYHSWSNWCRKELMEYAKSHHIPFILRSHGTGTNFSAFFRLRYPPFFGMKKWIGSFLNTRKSVLLTGKEAPLNRLVFLEPYGSLFKGFDYYYASKLKLPNACCIPNTFPALKRGAPFFREKYGLTGVSVFTCAASACTTKQQLLFIRQARRMDLQNIVFLFLVPQRNSYAEQMEKAIGNHPGFRILYNLPRHEVEAAISESDAMFLYSYQEQQPLCILEAMSCGIPWIAPDIGCISVLKGGIMLKRRTPGCLKKALTSMLAPDTRKSLGAAGFQQWQQRYAPHAVYTQWEALFRSAKKSENYSDT